MLQRVIYTLIFSLLLSSMISGWLTFINLGSHPEFLEKWLFAFVNAWPAAFIAAFMLAKPIGQVTAFIMKIIKRFPQYE